MKKYLIFTLCAVTLTAMASAVSLQDWLKRLGQQRGTKPKQRYTTVAAVRGLDDPSQVDPKARNYDAVKVMENRVIPQDILDQFIQEGPLKQRELPSASGQEESTEETVMKSLDIAQSAVPKKMKSAVRPITTKEEIQIGKDVAANVTAQFDMDENEALNAYVNLVGLAVARTCPRKDITFRFAVLDTNVINAFAAPGGYIFITKGLLRSLKNEAQLACVLGHEIAHVTQKHVVKEIQKSNIAQAVIPDYVKASAQKAQWMSQVTDLCIQMLWRGLSREDELEADRIGLQFASASGYQGHSFREVLEMLKDRSASSGNAKDLKFMLSTHPKPQDRLTAVAERLNSLKTEGAVLEDRFKKSVL
jgi:predicted Zn-dependent protease